MSDSQHTRLSTSITSCKAEDIRPHWNHLRKIALRADGTIDPSALNFLSEHSDTLNIQIARYTREVEDEETTLQGPASSHGAYREEHIQFRNDCEHEMYHLRCKQLAANTMLDYLMRAEVPPTWQITRHRFPLFSDRGGEYLRAAFSLEGHNYPNSKQYFTAIAQKCPKANGAIPHANSVRSWAESHSFFQANNKATKKEIVEALQRRFEKAALTSGSDFEGAFGTLDLYRDGGFSATKLPLNRRD